MKISLFATKIICLLVLSSIPTTVFSQYQYVECRCEVDFTTPDGQTHTIRDSVYCPTSHEYNYSCSGSVIGWSLDTICQENGSGQISRSPSYAPANSSEVPGSLSCRL